MEGNTTCEFRSLLDEHENATIMGIVGSVIAPIAVICNMITLIAIIKFHRLETKSLLSVANISACALLAGLTQPMHSLLLLGELRSSRAWCKVATAYEIIEDTLLFCSFLTVCFVAFERYISIFHPFKQDQFLRGGKNVAFIVAIWIISISNSFILFFWHQAEFIMSFVDLILTLIGILWISVVYIKVILLVRSIRRRVADSERRFSTQSLPRRLREHSKRTWPTVIVIFFLIVFFLAHNVVHILKSLSLKRNESPTYKFYSTMLAWIWLLFLLVSTITPVTLWLSSSRIRWFLRRFCMGCLCQQDELTSTYETRDSKLSKFIGLLLLAQRIRSERNNNHLQVRNPAVIYNSGMAVSKP